jgi:hypothetical protein
MPRPPAPWVRALGRHWIGGWVGPRFSLEAIVNKRNPIIILSLFLRAVLAQSILRLATGWTVGVLAFDYRRGPGIFLFTTVSRMALGPIQPSIQWIPGTLSLGIKRPGRESDHSPPFSAAFKNAWRYTSTPQYVFMPWCLVKHRDNFYFQILSLFLTGKMIKLGHNVMVTSCLWFHILNVW